MKRKQLPLWAQWCLGIGVTLIALAATALSMTITVCYGWQISPAAAAASALSDLTLAIVPVVSAAYGWNLYRRVLLVVCAAWSVFTAASFFADEHAQHLLERSHTVMQAERLAERVDALQAELASFRGLAATAAIKQRLAIVKGQVEREAARGGCGPDCEALVAKQDRILAELGKAQQRDRIAAELARVRKQAGTIEPVEPSGLALLASRATGIDKGVWAQGLQAFAVAVVLLLIELCRHQIGEGARIIAGAMKPRRKPAGQVVPLDRGQRGLAKLAGVK